MVGAVLAGDGLERVAEIASAHAGAPIAVIVPRLGVPFPRWERYARYVAAPLPGGGARGRAPGPPASPAGGHSARPSWRPRCRSHRAGASWVLCFSSGP